MTELEAEALAARLTRIWTPMSTETGGDVGTRWSFRFGIFDFAGFVADEVRVEMKFHKDGGYLRLNRELVPKDDERAWYKEPQVTITGSLYVDEEGNIYAGANEPKNRKTYAEFAGEWLPLFRRNCWLSGFPIECTAHEQVEWGQDFAREELEAWTARPLSSLKPDGDYSGEIDRQTQSVLAKFDMTLSEYFLMGTVGYSIYLPPEELADYTRELVEGDPRGDFSVGEYLLALDSSIAKGWLQVTTEQSYEAEAKRRHTSSLPELVQGEVQVGEIEFTAQGYQTFRQTILEIFGQEHIDQKDSGWNLQDERCEFEVLAPSRRWLQKRVADLVEDLQGDTSCYAGEEVEIGSVGQAEPIGPWKPDTFVTLEQGWRCVIGYKQR